MALPRAAGLIRYIRYHDDVLAVYSSRQQCKVAIADLKQLATGIWVVKTEEVLSHGKHTVFLDLAITITSPKLEISASQQKPVTPLCATSSHNPHIHASWPKAVAKRCLTLSGGDGNVLSLLSNRYRSSCTHTYTQSLLDSFAADPASVLEKASKSRVPISGAQVVPFVCRFHPLNRWAVSRALQLVPPPPELKVEFRSSWRNALPSTDGLVKKARLELCKRVYGREGRCFLFSNLSNSDLHNFGIGLATAEF